MSSLNSFKFHRFNDIPTNKSLEISKYLYNTDGNKRKKTVKQGNDFNFSNSQTLKLLPYNKLLDIENENENEMNFKNNNYSPYLIQEIINQDFEKLFKNGQISKINNFLPQIAYFDLDNSNEIEIKPEVKLVVSKYQQILRYLFNLEKKMKELNNKLEKSTDEIINPKEKIFSKENKIDNKIEENENRIFILENKISRYKEIILFNKKPQKSLSNFVLDIHDENFNYYCDICPDIKFDSYKEVQIHYLNEHKHILKIREANNNKKAIKIQENNNNIEKFYFETKLDLMKDEIKYLLLETNLKKGQDSNYNNQEEINFNLRNFQINNNKMSSSKNLKNVASEDNINLYMDKIDIDEIENQFNKYEKMNEILLNNFVSFKKDIFNNLQNLQNNKPIVFSSYNINIFNENKNKNIPISNESYLNLGQKYDDGVNEKDDYNNNNYDNNHLRTVDNKSKNKNIEIKNFYKTFKEREKKIIYNKNLNYTELNENYSKLMNNGKKERISRKVDNMIDNKYKDIIDRNTDKKDLKKFINDIYNKNHSDKNFNILLSIFDLKDLKNI